MTPREFIALAKKLAVGTTEAEWRTSVSRSYYAVFHGVRSLLADLGLTFPRAETAHQFLIRRLNNCGSPLIKIATSDLDDLRRLRNRADYDWRVPFNKSIAGPQAVLAEQIMQALDSARSEPVRSQITDAIKIYERDVLKTVTWRS